MAAQRPKRNNSPINSKNQPLKATVPLSSLVRKDHSPARRTSPSSPGLPPDKRNRLRRSPDVPFGDHRTLLSPLGSKVSLFKPVVIKSRNGKNIRRTNSLETLSSSYINGQWPREASASVACLATAQVNGSIHPYMCSKQTQTPFQWDEQAIEKRKTCALSNNSVATNTASKEIFRQCLQRKKQQSTSQPSYGKQSPVQGDHSAVSHYVSSNYTPSKPVSIPQGPPSSPKYPSLHTRRSVEGLNIELEGLDLEAKDDIVFARTPPEGRRPPNPPSTPKNVDMHTQTANGWVESFSPTSNSNTKRHSASPPWVPQDQKTPIKEHITTTITSSNTPSQTCESYTPSQTCESPLISSSNTTNLKYASSPKPNNSFWFARRPPDGAEGILPLSVEEIESDAYKNEDTAYSCPDTSKVAIQFSKNSLFYEPSH